MKKLLSLLLVLVALCALSACQNNKTDGLKDGATIIEYCTWGFGTEEEYNLTRRLVDKFNYDNDDIQIKIVEPEGDYDTFLETKASNRELPDVFMVNSVPKAAGRLAADITEIANADPEWATVDQALRDTATYNGHSYGIPAGQYYMGFFANYTLIQSKMSANSGSASEKFAPGAFTTDEFIEMVKACKDLKEDATSTIGLNATGDMINWLPSALDETGKTGHFVWNAENKKFDYRSDIMIAALTKINELGNKEAKYTYDNAVADDSEGLYFGSEATASSVFQNGQMAFIQDGTWSTYTSTNDCEYMFVGYADGRVVSASDYCCISRGTEDINAAWTVAKYMTFGKEGRLASFDIIEEANQELDDDNKLKITGIPVTNDAEVSAKWFEYVTLKGAKEVYEKVQAGEMTLLVEGNKTVPGFQDARFLASTGLSYPDVRGGAVLNMSDFIWDVCSGAISVSTYQQDFTEELANKMNQYVTDAYAEIDRLTNR